MATSPEKIATHPLDADGLHILQSAVSGYDHNQLLWSSGYLAGMAAAREAGGFSAVIADQSAAKKLTWSVFYATETGNSRHIAESLGSQLRAAGLGSELHDIRDYRPRSLAKVENAFFVIATHGNGEAPDGCEQFFEYWLSDKAPQLDKLTFSVLALGDSSYVDFCEMGKLLDERLSQLGATRLFDRADCDLDFETPADSWISRIAEHATDNSDVVAIARPAHLRPVATSPKVSRNQPFDADILVNQKITGSNSSKDVRHIELDLGGSDLTYLPGDSLGIVPQNPPALVDTLLESLSLDGGQDVSIDDRTMSLATALTVHKEVTVLSKPFLDTASAESDALKKIVGDRPSLAEFFKTRQVIDVVADYPRGWEAQEFVDSLRRLTPRLYSIASSPDANPDEAHLTVAVVKYDQFGRSHWGAASNRLISGIDRVPVYIERNDHFRLPADGNTPVIMIGAGTGIAPYRAFVEHRREHGHRGDNWLIFGDRNRASDFLYQIEWLRYRADGSLKRLDVAFSRDQQDKLYVQHRILEQATLMYSWLQRGAQVYVCGDADYMANDVHDALLKVLAKAGGLNQQGAADYLAELKSAHRYQRDVY